MRHRLILLLVPLLAGWNDAGHATVALIARDRISKTTRDRVLALLAKHPAWESWKGHDPFAKAANWPDEIRREDHPQHADHRFEDHFINLPHGTPLTEDQSLVGVNARPNIVKRLKQCVATLKNPDVEASVRARELAWLFHLVGDIHQPLHCTARISAQFPQGDRGGNGALVAPVATELKGDETRLPNLHAFWDDLIQEPSPELCPEPKGNLKKFNPEGWAWESFRLALREVYTDDLVVAATPARKIPALPAGYAERAREVARKQIALAGGRLAALLVDIFGE